MTRLLLQDPSIYTTASSRDFGVNCFTAAQSDNICGARKGDIVLLRCVEVYYFQPALNEADMLHSDQ